MTQCCQNKGKNCCFAQWRCAITGECEVYRMTFGEGKTFCLWEVVWSWPSTRLKASQGWCITGGSGEVGPCDIPHKEEA